jgi:hypothetical protein
MNKETGLPWSVRDETLHPLVDFVAWIMWWQNRKAGRVVRSDRKLWVRQEVLRVAEGIRVGRLNGERTAETIFESIDIGVDCKELRQPTVTIKNNL